MGLPGQSVVFAQGMHAPTQAQKDAIAQWAEVIRRGQTARVMYQVADLLKKVGNQVEALHDEGHNYVFLICLRAMHEAATLRARGLQHHDRKLLDSAEDKIRHTLHLIRGEYTF